MDSAYLDAGALVVDDPAKIWADVDLLVKVKEPIEPEFALLHEGLILFTYLHLAADPALTAALVRSGATGVAYETVEDANGHLPLLAPMSEIAGPARRPGRGPLPDHAHGRPRHIGRGSPRCRPGEGACARWGSSRRLRRPRCSWSRGGCHDPGTVRPAPAGTSTNGSRGRSVPLMSDAHSVIEQLASSDAVIGAVLVPGAAAPKLVTRAMLSSMPSHAVIVDVAIDQGGCTETSRPTTHEAPTYVVDDVLALLRGQYARRGPGYFDPGTDKCHAAVPAPPDRSRP